MIIIMKPECSTQDSLHVEALLDEMGLPHSDVGGADRSVLEVMGEPGEDQYKRLQRAPMVDQILTKAPPMLATDMDGAPKEITLGPLGSVGGKKVTVIAGPCSVESEDQIMRAAEAVAEAGAIALRGGAFKPRTAPYSFQGLGERGLELLAKAREATGLAIVTEVMCCEQAELVNQYTDVLQIGSRNMHNYHLLATVGRLRKPVLLKRGWASDLDEFLYSAEYILRGGNREVILCERGIRTFETHGRNTLALAAVPELKRRTRLPVIVDPSHGTGDRDIVAPMSYAAIACGADGLLVEVHPHPESAWSDGPQTQSREQFREMMDVLPRFASAAGRSF